MASLTALETVRDSGPGYCLITSMPMDWSVAFCVEEGFLGAMRAMSLRFARRAVHTLFARTAGVNVSRIFESTPGTGVDKWWVPRYMVR